MSEKMEKQKILITSALPYVNGLPHLGHLAGCLLPSDVFARFNRLIGNDVLYIGGTDEHGTPSELGAKKEGMDVYDYTTKYHNIHKDIYQKFNLSFDYFGRTSSDENIEITQQIAKELFDNGYIEEREVEQVFSVDDNMFLPDRYIVGTCPYCRSENARGDQCENCTKVLDPKDLINPKSAISGSKNLEVRKTSHLYLKLSQLSDKVRDWVNSRNWNKLTLGIANKWLDEGLSDRCITRDLKWGVPVPVDVFPNMKDKVFYVWFDAPIGYISITKQLLGDGYKNWWFESCGADSVKYVQFMGKDNVPFHAIFFPAMLLGTGENWTFVDYLKGLSYLTFEGGKFSKSEKRGVFADKAVEEFPADYWRYWLMANAPESSDASFTFDSFAAMVNKDLNGVLGNFVSRVLKMTASKFSSEIPDGGEYSQVETELAENLQEKVNNYLCYMENMEIRKAMNELRAIWVEGNNYISTTEPWTVIKENPQRAAAILRACINLIRIFAILSAPIMPKISQEMLARLNLTQKDMPSLKDFNVSHELNFLKAGHKFNVGEPLFERITSEKLTELKLKYGCQE